MSEEGRTLAEWWEVVEDVWKVCSTCGKGWLGVIPRGVLDAVPPNSPVLGVCEECAIVEEQDLKRFAKTFQGVAMVKGSVEELEVEQPADVEQQLLDLNDMPNLVGDMEYPGEPI